ncbi:hypothetical protein V3C99_007689 [Haemonchus contortus]
MAAVWTDSGGLIANTLSRTDIARSGDSDVVSRHLQSFLELCPLISTKESFPPSNDLWTSAPELPPHQAGLSPAPSTTARA